MTAAEYHQIMKIFLPCARKILSHTKALTAIQHFLEFFYGVSLPVQTDATIRKLHEDVRRLNETKAAFISASPSQLKFHKWHSIVHVGAAIKEIGTPDNVDTEMTEHQHISDNKICYRRSNKKDIQPQFAKHISHSKQ